MWISLLLALTAAVFLLPLLPALRELRLRQDILPVAVDPANAGNIDYFAESFLEFITPAIDAYQSGQTPRLLDQDYCLYLEDGRFEANTREAKALRTDRVVVGFGNLQLPAGFNFTQEVFSQKNIDIGESSRLRSILATEDLHFGKNSALLRWAHARNITVASGCRLLGRVSAEADMVLQPHCEFIRLNARRIMVAPISNNQTPEVHTLKSQTAEVTFLREYADANGRVLWDNDLDFPEHGLWRGDLVIRGHARIRANARIHGSLKVYGDVQIEASAIIDGTLVSNGSIHIANGCTVQGPVVSEQSIIIDSQTHIGDIDKPSTVTAPSIQIASGVVVYGSLWARNRGAVLLLLEDPSPRL